MIIGTAGHVDHGKTELIKALTGIDTDRLHEEKERGISIDIGFAPYRLPDGKLAGVIDVPGHEKFIHNMLAGIGGIDLVLLVIDATEGVMPQTREHLDILNLLQVQKGLVVITKVDLVEEEWLEMVKEDVEQAVKGSFLEGASVHVVSSVTGLGLEELRKAIDELAEAVVEKDTAGPLRVPVDRIFSASGFGTVITGTILGGTVVPGQRVEVLPPGKECRVRGGQVHGRQVEKAVAGQRVALNLAGLEKKDVVRGSVVAEPGYFHLTRYCDARLVLLPSAPRPLINMAPVHFYLGTTRVVSRMRLLGCEELAPGETGFAQCRLDRAVVARRGDPFIIRSYSPMRTIGGGVVLDENPVRHKRFRQDVLERLKELEKEDPLPFVLQKLGEKHYATLQDLALLTQLGQQSLREIMERALEQGEVMLLDDLYVRRPVVERWEKAILQELEAFHRARPLQRGMQKARAFGLLPGKTPQRLFDALIERLRDQGRLETSREFVFKSGFQPEPGTRQEEQLRRVEALFKEAGLNSPAGKEIGQMLGLKNDEEEELLDYLQHRGVLVKVAEDMYLHRDVYKRGLQALARHFQDHPTLTLAQYRDILQTSRKLAQILLEHFDAMKYTRRVEDERVPWKVPTGSDATEAEKN